MTTAATLAEIAIATDARASEVGSVESTTPFVSTSILSNPAKSARSPSSVPAAARLSSEPRALTPGDGETAVAS